MNEDGVLERRRERRRSFRAEKGAFQRALSGGFAARRYFWDTMYNLTDGPAAIQARCVRARARASRLRTQTPASAAPIAVSRLPAPTLRRPLRAARAPGVRWTTGTSPPTTPRTARWRRTAAPSRNRFTGDRSAVTCLRSLRSLPPESPSFPRAAGRSAPGRAGTRSTATCTATCRSSS